MYATFKLETRLIQSNFKKPNWTSVAYDRNLGEADA